MLGQFRCRSVRATLCRQGAEQRASLHGRAGSGNAGKGHWCHCCDDGLNRGIRHRLRRRSLLRHIQLRNVDVLVHNATGGVPAALDGFFTRRQSFTHAGCLRHDFKEKSQANTQAQARHGGQQDDGANLGKEGRCRDGCGLYDAGKTGLQRQVLARVAVGKTAQHQFQLVAAGLGFAFQFLEFHFILCRTTFAILQAFQALAKGSSACGRNFRLTLQSIHDLQGFAANAALDIRNFLLCGEHLWVIGQVGGGQFSVFAFGSHLLLLQTLDDGRRDHIARAFHTSACLQHVADLVGLGLGFAACGFS